MSNRYFGYDLITFLETLANDTTNGINAVIAAINTERSLTGDNACPIIANITNTFPKGYLPEMIIDVDSSELDNEDMIGGGGSTFAVRDTNRTPETFRVLISIMHKSNNINLNKWMEIYGEAIYRAYHNYTDDNITWIIATESIRDQIYFDEQQTGKIIGYAFDVRIDHC